MLMHWLYFPANKDVREERNVNILALILVTVQFLLVAVWDCLVAKGGASILMLFMLTILACVWLIHLSGNTFVL